MDIFKIVKTKLNSLILNLTLSGIVLLMMAILIVWTNFALQLFVGVVVLVIAFSFFYGAYKIWTIKKLL